MRLTGFYRMRISARSMISCGLNISNGSRREVANRISTDKTGQPDLAKRCMSNTPVPKTWKIYSEANRLIPTSSTISLARRAGTAEAVAEGFRPAPAADGMSRKIELFHRLARLIGKSRQCPSRVIIGGKEGHPFGGCIVLEREFSCILETITRSVRKKFKSPNQKFFLA